MLYTKEKWKIFFGGKSPMPTQELIDDLARDDSHLCLIWEEQNGKRKPARRLFQFVMGEIPKRRLINIIAPTLRDAVNIFDNTKEARGDKGEPIAVYLLDEVVE